MWTTMMGSEGDWQLKTTPQPALNNQAIRPAQGKLLGGSSAINGQGFIGPSQLVYDSLAKLGANGWTWENIYPYFKRSYTLQLQDPATRQHLDLGSWAKKEVILSCGALNTPKILELSGIGNKNILGRYRISVVVDNSNIGENLQDHLMTGISFEVVDRVITGDALMRQEPETMQEATKLYYEHNAGPLTIGSVQSTAFMPCLDENGARDEKHIKDLMDRFLSDTERSGPSYSPYLRTA
ncbi:glucose dehydrogenase [Aspergillus arachidicola]|uniref:Glucose dehydrogenase n=1 Tax=Aspergillus arachidicola TaxID=656916 RepID=A0A2G7FIM0_9EURO|nr:glucose dehydrogenase [Aspergillus arachidicola]